MEVVNVKEEYRKLIATFENQGKDAGGFSIAKYLGTMHVVYNVPVPQMQKMAKEWAKTHQTISKDELVLFVDALFHGKSREEKNMVSLLLGRFPRYLQELESASIDKWMGELTGWEEVDSFCAEISAWRVSAVCSAEVSSVGFVAIGI